MTPEGKILLKITDFLKAGKLGYIRLALQPTVSTGWPDLLVLMPGGMPVFLEVKRPGKTPSPRQEIKLKELTDAGFIALWFDDADKAINAVIDIMGALGLAAGKLAAGGTPVSVVDPAGAALHGQSGGLPGNPPERGPAA